MRCMDVSTLRLGVEMEMCSIVYIGRHTICRRMLRTRASWFDIGGYW